MIKVLILLLVSSCAHHTKKNVDPLSSEMKRDGVSPSAITNLARTSYLKGCVDSKNYFLGRKAKPAFDKCLELAINHAKEIELIIHQNLSPKR